MDFIYFLYLATFLIFPILGYLVASRVDFYGYRHHWMGICAGFAVYDILLVLGISIIGDFADCVLLSAEYLLFCIGIFAAPKIPGTHAKIIRLTGLSVLGIGFVQALVGILLFIPISHDYIPDRKFNFSHDGKRYETRRYRSGFATQDDIKYAFETYRKFDLFPFEKNIDKTVFLSSKTRLGFESETFEVGIQALANGDRIQFSSENEIAYKRIR